MDKENFKDLFELAQKRRKDPDYIYEHSPTFNFLNFISEKLGRDDIELHRNEDDPPDYFLKIDDRVINLEVTTIVYEKIIHRNSFLKSIEDNVKKVLVELGDDLPPKRVIFYLIPGDKVANLGNSKITIPNFSTRATQSKLYDNIKKSISEQIENLFNGKTDSILIRNKEDQVFAKLFVKGIQDSENFQFFIFPNPIYKADEWEIGKLSERINKRIASKLNIYSSDELEKNEWWILLCDPQNEMNLAGYIDKLKEIEFEFGNFEKAYLSIDDGASYQCIELKN